MSSWPCRDLPSSKRLSGATHGQDCPQTHSERACLVGAKVILTCFRRDERLGQGFYRVLWCSHACRCSAHHARPIGLRELVCARCRGADQQSERLIPEQRRGRPRSRAYCSNGMHLMESIAPPVALSAAQKALDARECQHGTIQIINHLLKPCNT